MNLTANTAALLPLERLALTAQLRKLNGLNFDIPLSFQQRGLWFHERLQADGSYLMPFAVRVRGILDTDALKAALRIVATRHEAFKTHFVVQDGDVVARVEPSLDTPLVYLALDSVSAEQRDDTLLTLIRELAGEPTDLYAGHLIKQYLIEIAPEDHVIVIMAHHIVGDAWSMRILMRDVVAQYNLAVRTIGNAELAPSTSYAEYVMLQRRVSQTPAFSEQIEAWRALLKGAPARSTFPSTAHRANTEKLAATHRFKIPRQLVLRMKKLCVASQTTLYMAMLSAFSILLARYSGQDDLVIGSPLANRQHRRFEEVVGLFATIVPLRIDLSADPTFINVLSRVRRIALLAYANQAVPLEKIVEVLRPARDGTIHPLFQVVFSHQRVDVDAFTAEGLECSVLHIENNAAKFDISLDISQGPTDVSASIEYATDRYNAISISSMARHFVILLQELVTNPDRCVFNLPILSKAESHKMLVDWNATEKKLDVEVCIHELFEARVAETPDAIAVLYEGRQFTYKEVNERANRLAHYLRCAGIELETPVALCLDRSVEMVISILAILKVGGVYVPLDPLHPVERLAYMLRDSAPAIILTDKQLPLPLLAMLRDVSINVLDLYNSSAHLQSLSSANLVEPKVCSKHLAYIIYTSGSTGRPKGVMVEHRNVINVFRSMYRLLDIKSSDTVLAMTTITFDIAALELLLPLTRGARVALLDKSVPLSQLSDVVTALKITVIQATPTMWRVLIDGGWKGSPDLKALSGGEPLTWELADDLRPLVAVLYNVYGPTETTIWSSFEQIEFQAGDNHHPYVEIGRAIDNTMLYILDRYRQPIPIGVCGELYIGGAGLARGYLNRPDLTKDRFVPSPFKAAALLYRTGDVARHLPDGKIDYVGRDDFQIKLRGFRIELGEIETRLVEHEHVRNAVVITGADSRGDKELIAYYTAKDDYVPVDAAVLRTYLEARLPDYMIPAKYVQLSSFPMTHNGKIDRSALPDPTSVSQAFCDHEAPLGKEELAVARIWEELLNLESIGRHDNFFALGGHSLLLLRLINDVRKVLAVDISMRDVYQSPTVATLSHQIKNSKVQTSSTSIELVPRLAPLRASFSQERLWYTEHNANIADAYNVSTSLRLMGLINIDALEYAITEVVRRHESLRTRFASNKGELMQVIDDPWTLTFKVTDVARMNISLTISDIERAPFDLGRDRLLRVRLLRLSAREHVIVLVMHHIITDGLSIGIFWNEVGVLYEAYVAKRPSFLPDLQIQYADYAAWQRNLVAGEWLERAAAYWQQVLDGIPDVLDLPTDRPRPATQTYIGADVAMVFPPELTAQLRAFSLRHQVTLFTTLVTGWTALLSRVSGQRDIVIGTQVANRTRIELQHLIGLFSNTVAIRVDYSGSPSVIQVLQHIKSVMLEAQQYQELPFQEVIEAAKPRRSSAHSPLFQVMFVWQDTGLRTLSIPNLDVDVMDRISSTAKYDLTLELSDIQGTISGRLEYASDLFNEVTIRSISDYLKQIYMSMMINECDGVHSLKLVPTKRVGSVGFTDPPIGPAK